MIPRASNYTYYSYTPETSANRGVLRGYDDEQDSKQKSTFDISTLQKDDFMKLLLAQMQNQNPLDPAGNTEFVAQLAQFSSLGQMMEMNTNLEKTLENNTRMAEAVNNAMMISYFGKRVSAESDSFYYDGQNPVELQFSLDSATSTGTLKIFDENGTAVRSIPLDAMNSGDNTIEWDAITGIGTNALAGVYSFSIEAFDILNNRVEFTPVFSGVVDGISYKDGKAHLKVGGILIPFASVEQIVENE